MLRFVIDRGVLGDVFALAFDRVAARRHVRQLIAGFRIPGSRSTAACRHGWSLNVPAEDRETKDIDGEQGVLPDRGQASAHHEHDEHKDNHDRDRDEEIELAADRLIGGLGQVASQQITQEHDGKTSEQQNEKAWPGTRRGGRSRSRCCCRNKCWHRYPPMDMRGTITNVIRRLGPRLQTTSSLYTLRVDYQWQPKG